MFHFPFIGRGGVEKQTFIQYSIWILFSCIPKDQTSFLRLHAPDVTRKQQRWNAVITVVLVRGVFGKSALLLYLFDITTTFYFT